MASMISLAPYDAARRALSAAVAVDEVKDILNKSLAMQVYAYQAKTPSLQRGRRNCMSEPNTSSVK
jgi:hypothetical protein